MTVRQCQRQDLPKIAEIEKACFSDAWTVEMLESEMERKDFFGLVAESDGALIGYAFATVLFENADLERIAILSKYRGKGFGGELLDALLSGAKAQGAEQIFLEVRVSNTSALGLYESRGFVRTRLRKGYYGGEDAAEMKKALL